MQMDHTEIRKHIEGLDHYIAVMANKRQVKGDDNKDRLCCLSV